MTTMSTSIPTRLWHFGYEATGSITRMFQAITTSTQFPFTYGQQLSYWYPQSYPSTAAATAAAQLQGQYLQGVQGYPYGQFGYQQGYVG